jgi:hypothetical protein
MPDERGAALRRLRGDMSVRAFTRLLAGELGEGTLSRHRLGSVEAGEAALPDALWDEIAAALIAVGHSVGEVAALRSTAPPFEPLPPSTPPQRLEQWTRVAGPVADNYWWRVPIKMITRATSATNLPLYQRIVARHWVDRVQHLRAVQERLELGAAGAGRWRASAADGVAVDRARSECDRRIDRAELFLLRLRLHNTGSVPWRDRLLYRVGAPVTTGTPFTPGVLPVPDTEPGQDCEVLIPGRAQWFRSLAAIHFVMVFPDLTPCLPGRLCCWIDARTEELDESLPLLVDLPHRDDGRPEPVGDGT